jgi:hypothetical protein
VQRRHLEVATLGDALALFLGSAFETFRLCAFATLRFFGCASDEVENLERVPVGVLAVRFGALRCDDEGCVFAGGP